MYAFRNLPRRMTPARRDSSGNALGPFSFNKPPLLFYLAALHPERFMRVVASHKPATLRCASSMQFVARAVELLNEDNAHCRKKKKGVNKTVLTLYIEHSTSGIMELSKHPLCFYEQMYAKSFTAMPY